MARGRRASLGVLFLLIAVGFAALGLYAARTGGAAWVVAVAAAALAVWMAELGFRAFR